MHGISSKSYYCCRLQVLDNRLYINDIKNLTTLLTYSPTHLLISPSIYLLTYFIHPSINLFM